MKFLILPQGNSERQSASNEESKLWPSDSKFAQITTD